MASGARRGAQPAVLRAMGLVDGDPLANRRRPASQTALCPRCGEALYFFSPLNGYGQTLERCTNVRCLNAIAHRPEPDPDAGTSKFREPRPRKRAGSGTGRDTTAATAAASASRRALGITRP